MNNVLLVRGETSYLVFIMLKAREAYGVVQETTQAAFIASYACQREVSNCLRDICEATKRISNPLRSRIKIPWQILDEIQTLDKRDASAVLDLAVNRLRDLDSGIKSLNPVFACDFVAYDSLKLAAGTVVPKGAHLSFFHEEPCDEEEPATKRKEAELAEWLLQDDKVKEWIGSASGLSSHPLHRTGIQTSAVDEAGQLGDIDAILFDPGQPERAVAIECKRVKASITSGVCSINGVDNIKKGIRQANALHRLGFNRSWLAVIIIVDGRGRTENNFLARGLQKKDFEDVFTRTYGYALHKKYPLAGEAGIMLIEIVQPKDKIIDDASFVSVCICRDAVSVQQPHDLSVRLRNVLEASAAGGTVL